MSLCLRVVVIHQAAGASRADQMVPFGVFGPVDAVGTDVNQRAVAVILYPQTGLVGRDLCWAESRRGRRKIGPRHQPRQRFCVRINQCRNGLTLVDHPQVSSGEEDISRAQEPTPEVGAHAPFCRVMTSTVPAKPHRVPQRSPDWFDFRAADRATPRR